MIFQMATVPALLHLTAQNQVGIAINGWWVILIFAVLVVVISLLMLGNRQVPAIPPAAVHGHVSHGSEQHAEAINEQVELAEIPFRDNLTKIEGIGPKIASLLSKHGINTFRELANAEVETLDRLLEDARLNFADPRSWPEQAKLANRKEWESLEKLKSQLKGGRKGS